MNRDSVLAWRDTLLLPVLAIFFVVYFIYEILQRTGSRDDLEADEKARRL
ncbi:hypothetical protein SAMN06265795_13116 [Noviherbaspirillum humi]|uniref:Uncharacterized protein n=1 Tax=Noviherbaspirillum humi TaxID=1688639 RepID=A0A239M3S8_9BURK|nr:hypothetical protein SAMN06265795_13116 [Noviherbaspirillum humi]